MIDAMRRNLLLLLSGLTLASIAPGPCFAESSAVARPSPRDPYGVHISEATQRFGLPAAWIRAILATESNGDPRAVSPRGAMGLMQLMPETWGDLRVRHRLGSDPYDPHDNIIAGAAYIRLLYDRYGTPGWIAAYNAGPGRYEASLKGRQLPSETRNYVATVAPHLDGSGNPGATVIAAVGPLSWTRAPLFIAQPTSKPAAYPVPGERASNEASAMPIVRDVSAIVPQSGGMFIARAGEGTAP
jgi:hypothetical protein